MSDKPWKKLERDVGVMIGGSRHWSNSGEAVDCSSERFIAQCKLVQRMSLEELTALVESLTAHAKEATLAHYDGMPATPKLPVVAVKLRRGKGKPSPTLVVMTSETFTRLCGYNQAQTS